jgi:hypothetical protein
LDGCDIRLEFWGRVRPDVGATQAQSPKLLMLTAYAGSDIGHRASYLWWALSRVGHHHRYELGLTLAELLRFRAELERLTAQLAGLSPVRT